MMGICAGKPSTKTSDDPNSQVEQLENGYQVNHSIFSVISVGKVMWEIKPTKMLKVDVVICKVSYQRH